MTYHSGPETTAAEANYNHGMNPMPLWLRQNIASKSGILCQKSNVASMLGRTRLMQYLQIHHCELLRSTAGRSDSVRHPVTPGR